VGQWSRSRPGGRSWSPEQRLMSRVVRVVGHREGADACSLCAMSVSYGGVRIGETTHSFCSGGFGSGPCRVLSLMSHARHGVGVAFVLSTLAPQSDARDSGVGDPGGRYTRRLARRVSSLSSLSFAFGDCH
jgi:hypothetical protein